MNAHAVNGSYMREQHRLLIAEDDENVALLVREVAKDCGFAVRIVHDGAQLLQAYDEFQPHAVILDINTPRMDGFEVLQFLKNRRSRARIMIMSVRDSYRVMAEQMGDEFGLLVDIILPKPFEVSMLIDTMRDLKSSLSRESLKSLNVFRPAGTATTSPR